MIFFCVCVFPHIRLKTFFFGTYISEGFQNIIYRLEGCFGQFLPITGIVSNTVSALVQTLFRTTIFMGFSNVTQCLKMHDLGVRIFYVLSALRIFAASEERFNRLSSINLSYFLFKYVRNFSFVKIVEYSFTCFQNIFLRIDVKTGIKNFRASLASALVSC